MSKRLGIGLMGLAAAGVAHADTIELKHLANGAGRDVTIGTEQVFAGQLLYSMQNGVGAAAALDGEHWVFATQLLTGAAGSYQTYEILDVPQIPGGSGPLGEARAAAIGQLYQIAGAQAHSGDHDYAAAFQLALWEISFDDPGALDLTEGAFIVTGGITDAMATAISGWFGAIGGSAGASGLTALAPDPGPDVAAPPVVVPVPLPAPVAIGLAGLGVVIIVRQVVRPR